MSVLVGGIRRLWGLGRQARADAPTAERPAATTGGSASQEPVVVWQAANPMEAQIVKGRLISAGIPAIVQGEPMGKIYGFTTGSLAATDVLVPGPLAEQAQALLEEEISWEADEETGE